MTFGLILQQRGHRHSLCLGTARRMCGSIVSGQFALATFLLASCTRAAHSCLSPDQHEHSLAPTVIWTRGLIQAKTITLQIINFSYTSSPNQSHHNCVGLPRHLKVKPPDHRIGLSCCGTVCPSASLPFLFSTLT